MNYVPTIGLEIHAELATSSKMFCDCANNPMEEEPNTNICPVCLAHPGTLPVINKKAVEYTVKTGLALNAQIERNTFFERKNYFYPDLPKGYQISQYKLPINREGKLEIEVEGRKKQIGIERIHLEEDTGKLIHPEGKNYSLVNFNRAGVPLMELVTKPDISSGQEAREFVKQLQLILQYLEVSKANMEKGELRAEVNISIAPDNSSKKALGTKVELKNLNSLRAVKEGIAYEIERQQEVLKEGRQVTQETRGWSPEKEKTFSQREKEESHDYQYFPEPDLPPFEIKEDFLEKLNKEMPELPKAKKERFRKQYDISEDDLNLYVTDKSLGDYFEKVVSQLRNWQKSLKIETREKEIKKLIKLASNYICSDLQGLLESEEIESLLITPENFAEFITILNKGEISSKIAKKVLKEMHQTGKDPSQIIKEKDLTMISGEEELKKQVEEVLSENPGAVEDYGGGKESAMKFLLGKVMAKTQGKANPETVNKLLGESLKKEK